MSIQIKPNIPLINILCRICGQEDKNCVPVFSEHGKKQAIQKKMRICLSVSVEESDVLPKQICLACLNKLDITWDLVMLCREGQIVIDNKLHLTGYQTGQATSSSSLCGVCNLAVGDNQPGIGCEGMCQKWHHRWCINMSMTEYKEMLRDSSRTWICENCKTFQGKKTQGQYRESIEQQLSGLKENTPVRFGDTALITLVPSSTPPSEEVTNGLMEMLQAPVMVNPASAPPNVSAPISYIQTPGAVSTPTGPTPQSLIQVNPATPSKPLIYHQPQQSRNPRKPMPSPKTVPTPKLLPANSFVRRPITAKRRALKEAESGNTSKIKRNLQVCTYCNKTFPDDIIDHHVNLHLRQSFITCIECNKNFRSEEAMSRHRCGLTNSVTNGVNNESINLDSDDEPVLV